MAARYHARWPFRRNVLLRNRLRNHDDGPTPTGTARGGQARHTEDHVGCRIQVECASSEHEARLITRLAPSNREPNASGARSPDGKGPWR